MTANIGINKMDTLLDEVGTVTELDTASAQIDNIGGAGDAVVAITDVCADAIKDGGFTKEEANLINVAVEELCNSIGVKHTSNVSLEQFANVNTASMALESFGETIAKIWRALMDAIGRAITWITDMYIKLFVSARSLNSKAKSLKEKAGKLGGAPKEKEFNSSSLANSLSIEGKVPQHIEGHLNNLKDTLKNSITANTKNVAVFKTTLKTYYSGEYLVWLRTDKIDGFQLASTDFPGSKTVANSEQYGIGDVPDTLKASISNELLGGKAILCLTPKQNVTGDDAYAVVDKVGCKFISMPKNENKSDVVSVLSTGEINGLIGSVIEITDALMAFESKEKEIRALKKDFLRSAEGLRVTLFSDSNAKKYFPKCQKITRFMARLLDEPITSVCMHSLRTSKYSLDYASKSMSQYSGVSENSNTGLQPA
jgi:hypothetical protein